MHCSLTKFWYLVIVAVIMAGCTNRATTPETPIVSQTSTLVDSAVSRMSISGLTQEEWDVSVSYHHEETSGNLLIQPLSNHCPGPFWFRYNLEYPATTSITIDIVSRREFDVRNKHIDFDLSFEFLPFLGSTDDPAYFIGSAGYHPSAGGYIAHGIPQQFFDRVRTLHYVESVPALGYPGEDHARVYLQFILMYPGAPFPGAHNIGEMRVLDSEIAVRS